ncbi:HAAS signaling domain-containing protein [Microbacterium aurum]
MNEQLSVLRDPRARAYLAEVHVAVAAVDPAAADGIMREIADHLREAAAEPGFDLDRTIAELGDPALIAAGVDAPAPRPAGFADSAAGVIVTVLALTVGTWWTFVIGWIVGVGLLWSSRRWLRTEKVIGTAAWPLAALAAASGGVFGGFWSAGFGALVVIPLAVGAWLLVQGLRAPRTAAAARPLVEARTGPGAWLERRPACAVAIAGPAIAALGAVVVALVGGHPAPLVAVPVVAALALVATLTVVWLSRSWEPADKGVITGLLALTVVAGAAAWAAAVDAGTAGTMCAGTECTPVVSVRTDVVVTIAAPALIPALLACAVLLGARFRAAGAPPRTPRTRVAIAVVIGGMTLGGAGFALLVLAQALPAPGLFAAAVGALAVWAAAIIAVWRSDAWTGLDAALATVVLPALAVVPLILPRGYSAPAGDGANPLLPGELGGFGSPGETALLWGVFAAASVVVAIWMAVRALPSGARRRRGGPALRAARARDRHRGAASPVAARIVGAAGLVAAVAYAAVAAVQILVWNPLAAVPGATLAEISGTLDATGETFDVPMVLGILAVGPMLALAPLILAWRNVVSALGAAASVCLIIAAGALGYFAASFGPGMSLADAYGISGADYAPWGRVLMLVSAAALVGAAACGVLALRRARGATMEG